MAGRIQFTRSAEKEFLRLPRDVQIRFASAFNLLEADPSRAKPGLDIKRLHGTRTTWRLRVGDYRGIYEREGEQLVFTRFDHRSRIYSV